MSGPEKIVNGRRGGSPPSSAGRAEDPRELPLGDDDLDLLDALLDAEGVAAPADLIPRRGAKVAPLSPAQRRLWFLHQLDPDSTAYTIAGGLLLRGALDAEALQAALGELIARHEALRTAFESSSPPARNHAGAPARGEGEPRQVVRDAAPFVVERARAASSAEAARLGSALARRPWDLARPPLVRAVLVTIAPHEEAPSERTPHEHALIVTMHHLVADGASLGVFFREIATLYEAFSSGKTSAAGAPVPRSVLPALPIQYADVALWQNEARDGGALEASLAWWKRALAGAPERLDLPYDRTRPSASSDRGARHSFLLAPADRLAALDALGRGEKATRFMVIVAAFAALLGRYSGQDDLAVGTPVSGRDRPETEDLIGFFVNTLVLRADLSGDPTFRTLLGRIRAMALGAYDHGDLPFDRLVEAVRPARAAGHTPLFQVMVAEEDVPFGYLSLSGLAAAPLEVPSETAQFDLTLTFAREEGGLRAAFDYATDLFDAGTIARTADHFRTFLEAIAAAPDAPLSSLPLMTAREERRLLDEWSQGGASVAEATAVPPALSLFDRFEVQAALTHDADALAFDGGTLSYAELRGRAGALARRLVRLGVGADVRVGVCLSRSPEAVVAILGILEAGGVHVPIDPAWPASRRAFVLQDSGAVALVTRSDLAVPRVSRPRSHSDTASEDGSSPAWPPKDTRVSAEPSDAAQEGPALVLVDRDMGDDGVPPGAGPSVTAPRQCDDAGPAPSAVANQDSRVAEGSLAWIVYTSGTTGTPRGVGVPHAAAAAHFGAVREVYGLGPADRTLLTGSLAFDASIEQILGVLLSGGTLVIPGPELLGPREILSSMRDGGATIVNLTAALWDQLVRDPALEEIAGSLPHLRLVLVGGDVVRPESVELWRARAKHPARLFNVYGPTETTITATFHEIGLGPTMRTTPEPRPNAVPEGAVTTAAPSENPEAGRRIPIGRPLPGRTAYILDRAGRPVPAGVAGELCLGGAGLARGYVGRPDRTAERFVPDPFGVVPGARLYRTGDRARWRPDGAIEFLGRADDQVKVRGFRVEPGEIEAALLAHPAVSAAAALPLPDPHGGARIAAFYIAGPGGSASILREHLRACLPEFMVPSRLTRLDALPLGPAGKIDRAALAALAGRGRTRRPRGESMLSGSAMETERVGPGPESGRSDTEVGGAERGDRRTDRAGIDIDPDEWDFVAPEGPVEEIIAGIWSGLLDVARVGATDDFFDLGGHSLIATQVVSRMRAALGVEIPLRAIFEAPTVRGLAGRVEAARCHSVPPPIARAPEAERRRLSYAQRRLWFLDRLEPGASYNLPSSVVVRGALDVPALERALTEVIRRHEALRTRIVEGPEGPEQLVDPPAPVVLVVEDLTRLPRERPPGAAAAQDPSTEDARGETAPHDAAPDDAAPRKDPGREAANRMAEPGDAARCEAARRTREETRRPFDLARGPLVRFILLRLAPLEHVLLVTVHHIAADGWSMGVLVREMGALYGAFARGADSLLEPLAFQYADWAAWQRAWLEGDGESGELQRQIAWWRTELDEAEPLALPSDRPRPARPTRAGTSLPLPLCAAVRDRLARLAREEGATLHMALLAGYAEALGRWSGQREIVVGTPVANRRIAEAETMIGFFVNTLPNRIRLSPGQGEVAAGDAVDTGDAAAGMRGSGEASARGNGGASTFRDLLRRVRETALGAYAHQDVPFERLVEALRPGRDTAHAPYVRTLFALQNAPLGEIALPGLSLVHEEPDMGICRFDLELFFIESQGGLDGTLNFSTELFDRATVEGFAANLAALLEVVANEPDRPLARIDALAPAERHRLLVEWNAPRETWPDPPIVHALFERRAARAPEAVAARMDGVSITYGELNARANRLARFLRRQGVGAEDLVAVCLGRSFEMLVALLGTMKGGAAYVPIDPESPESRIALLLEDAGATVVLTDARLAQRLPASGARTIRLDADRDAIALEEAGDLGLAIAPDALVYVTYTSGSTGRPKGVAMTHRATANLLSWQRRDSAERHASAVLESRTVISDSSEDPEDPMIARTADSQAEVAPRTLQFASLSFDVSFQEIFSTLTAGGEILLVTEQERRDAARLLWIIAEQQVERLFLPFVALDQLAETAAVEDLAPAGLREIDTAGEQLRITPAIAGLLARLPGCRLVNHYGPSETHLVTTFEVGGDPSVWPPLPPIGRPIANAPVYLLDDEGRPVPLGAAGEVYVGGAGLARGYHARPRQTAERFLPDPFSAEPGARLYRTGDLARWRASGELEFLGRRDDQVKVRGYRVEPGEIEAALARHPAVRQAVVAAREHRGGKRLAAWVVLDEPEIVHGAATEGAHAEDVRIDGARDERSRVEGARVPAVRIIRGELREHLARILPEYMVPAAIVPLAALPLTRSGKIDRGALPEPDWAASGESFVPPRTPEEEIVCGIVADVLGLERVGATDDFFDLGGHSLLATQVVSRVRRALGAEVPLRALFEDPTPAGVAAAAAASREGAVPVPPPLAPAPEAERRKLSFAQQRLWFLDRMEPGAAVYNLPVAVRLEGELDAAALRRALAEIVSRHEALRTRFPDGPDGPVAIADAPFDATLEPEPVLTEAAGPGPSESDARRPERVMSEVEAAASRILADEAKLPFDLARGPLLRTRLLRLGPRDHVLSLVAHHIAADGWSIGVLVRELGALYGAYAAGGESPLPPTPVQYADWAAWQRRWLEGGELDRQLAWWRGALDGAPRALDVPSDRARPAVATGRGATLDWRSREGLAERLGRIARREGATLQMALLAGYAATLMRQGGIEEVVVGTPVANRRAAEAEALIGFFVNTLAVRVRGGRGRGDRTGGEGGLLTFRELLARVREASLGAYANQDVPFERVVEELRPERSLNRAPLFQTAFALQNAPIPRIELVGLRMTAVEMATGTAKFDLMLVVEETTGGSIGGAFEYSTDLFDEATIATIGRRLERTLEAAAAAPDAPLAEIPWMDEEESRRILDWSGGTHATEPPLLHALIERQVARTPDAPALALGDETISYREMDARANRLAHHLRALGAGPETRVAVLLERSPQAIVAAFAVLKAGAAWVPLDPAQPDRRLADLVEECGAAIVVTEGRFTGKLDGSPPVAGASAVTGRSAPHGRLAGKPPATPAVTSTTEPHCRSTGKPTAGPAVTSPSDEGSAGGAVAPETCGPTAGGALLVTLDAEADRSAIAVQSPSSPATTTHPANLAYAIFTSGSTGRPKAVGVEHRQIAAYVAAAIDRLSIEPGWRFLLVSTLAADLGHTSLFPALATGGCLHVLPLEIAFDAPRFEEYVAGHAIDAIKIVPSHLQALLGGPRPEKAMPRRLLVLGGEGTSGARLAALRALAPPDCRIAIHYGPTEATVGAVAGDPEAADVARTLAPLGRPLANSRAWVADLDDLGRLAPPGVPGELVLGGDGVARGYLGRPDLTAERFVPDPISGRPGARSYRTGDRARWLTDGRIEFLGRTDAQVKVRGYRVELGEIESAIAALPGVRAAAVAVRDEITPGTAPTGQEQGGSTPPTGSRPFDTAGRTRLPSGRTRLVACVVPEPRLAPTIGGLARRRLASGLAVAELNRNETDYIEREIFETRAYLRHGIALRDGDTIFDVGANIGLFTVFSSLACAQPRIVAFEPNPHLRPILRANAAAYAPEATILDVGLAAAAGEAAFTFFPGFSLLSGLHADAGVEKGVVRAFLENRARAGEDGAAALASEADALLDERFSGRTLTVRLRTLSEVVAELGIEQIHLLKVNVEKSELDVLRGIRDGDWTRIDQAVVEVDVAANLAPIVALFEAHGFDVHVEQDPLLSGTELGYVYAARRGSGRALVPGAPPSAAVRVPEEPLLSPESLRALLARTLPDHMVPASWVFIDTLPLTANGKLDRARLPDPHPPAGTFTAPRGERERAIAAIWAEALGVERVGVNDNFFDLGGHSLLLAQVHARLTASLGADLSVVELFRYPTVAALAERLATRTPTAGAAETDRARGADRRTAVRARARTHRAAEKTGSS